MSETGTIPTSAESSKAIAYRQRLVVYVAWHPGFEQGAELARQLYDQLTRDSQQPIARGLGIPVFFRSVAEKDGSEAPRPIPLDKAHHTAVVVLVDGTLVLQRELGWGKYLSDLNAEVAGKPDRHRLLPVKLDDDAFAVARHVEATNFIRPSDDRPAEEWLAWLRSNPHDLLIPITHELCRLLLGEPRLEHGKEDLGGRMGKPVQVFISHAKVDGAPIARRIRDHINQNLSLKTFFDVNDIPPGSGFERVLENIADCEHTAMLVVQTDAYSTREWCQREVLWAKKYERPVLILHGVRFGEKCSFPYLGNAPTIRFDPETGPDFSKVLSQLLLEVLRNVHFRRHFEDLAGLFELGEGVRALPQTPELLTLLELKSDPKLGEIKTVVYQEPPLGEHLLDVLRRFVPDLVVTTPVHLLTSSGRPSGSARPLAGRTIGLSIADSPDLDRRGFNKVHADDAAVEFARYLLEAGASLAYGGTLQAGGITELLRDLVWTYQGTADETPRLFGYLAWPYHRGVLHLDRSYKKWMDPQNFNRVRFEFVEHPDGLAGQAGAPNDRSAPNLLVYARCLTAMRQAMEARTDARILLGGKLTGFMGRYPGLVEEAVLAKRGGKLLYLVGGFGGAAGALIDALERRPAEPLTEVYQFRDAAYRQMVEDYNQLPGIDRVDYPALVRELADWGIDGLCACNGLTPEENRRLFETPHIIEMVYLVLRGLLRQFGRQL